MKKHLANMKEIKFAKKNKTNKQTKTTKFRQSSDLSHLAESGWPRLCYNALKYKCQNV